MNFWSGPKADMEMSDGGSHAFFGGGKHASAVEVPEAGADYYAIRSVPHGQVREVWYDSKVTGTWRHALVYLPPGYEEPEIGVQHVYWESPGTGHEWQTWRRDLRDFAPRQFR